jgi:hypothetical protein
MPPPPQGQGGPVIPQAPDFLFIAFCSSQGTVEIIYHAHTWTMLESIILKIRKEYEYMTASAV